MCKKYKVRKFGYNFDNRWTSEKELLKEKRFKHYLFKKLKKCNEDGVVIRSEIKGNKHHVNMYNPNNTIVINAKDSSDNEIYINSSIQILSSCSSKSSFVILDTKGEYYSKNVRKLTEEGYEVKVLDLSNPHATTKWNPMDNAFVFYQRAHNLKDEVETFKDTDPAKTKYKVTSKEYASEWYGFDGVAYPTMDLLESAISDKVTKLRDLAENELHQIAKTICPNQNDSESNLELTAQNFIFGVMLTMLEDAISGEQGMTRDTFNLYNLSKICILKDDDKDDPYSTLKNYFINKDTTSKVYNLVSPVLNTTPNLRKSFMDIVTHSLSLFLDKTMCFATSENEIDFDGFTDKPTAFFIKMPNEESPYSIIATMCIYQIYTRLIYKANNLETIQGFRNVYLFLDDFENLPKIDKFDAFVTIGRSRKILSVLFIPSYESVYNKYGEEMGKIIIGNCNIHIYFNSYALKTKESFSYLCGDVYYNNKSRPLIYPDELGHIPNNCAIVKILREYPFRAKFG